MNAGSNWNVANYLTAGTVVYTRTRTGLEMQIANGAPCGNVNRAGTIMLTCNATATTPYMTSSGEGSGATQCHYYVTIQTSTVCGTPGTPTSANSAVAIVTTNGPTYTSCGGAGFDLSSVNMQFNYTTNDGTRFDLMPCGTLVDQQSCSGSGSSWCQSTNNVVSTWNPSLATWIALPTGVEMTIQDGASCGANFPRAATILFICNRTATTPVLNYVYEQEYCHYEAFISTAAACSQYSSLILPSNTVGSTFYSATCGGGIYPNLASLASYPDFSANGFTVAVCTAVTNPQCASVTTTNGYPTSFCQGGGVNVASYYPAAVTPQYTVTSTGLIMTIQDGTQCNNVIVAPRVGKWVFICTPTATTPVLLNVTELESCHYYAYFATNIVCGGSIPPVIHYPSSSSSSAPVRSSSSSTAAPGLTSAPTTTPAGRSSSGATSAPTSTPIPLGPTSSGATSAGPTAGPTSNQQQQPGATSASTSSPLNPVVTNPSSSTADGLLPGGGGAVASSSSSKLSGGAIAGIVIGVVAGVLLLCLLCFCLLARNRKGKSSAASTRSMDDHTASSNNNTYNTQHDGDVEMADVHDAEGEHEATE